MRPLIRLVVGIGLLLILLVAVAFSLPQEVTVARSKVINAPESDVFPYVNSPKRFNEWSPWAARDPEMKFVFSGPEEGKGAKMQWSSDEFDTGSQEIVESQPNSFVKTKLNFGDMGTANSSYQLRPDGAGTKVIWIFETNTGNNPIKRWMGLMFERWIGKDYEMGLDKLKEIAEAAQ